MEEASIEEEDEQEKGLENWRHILKLLLDWGADVQEGFDMLMRVVVRNPGIDDPSLPTEAVRILELFLSHGLDPNQPDFLEGTRWIYILQFFCSKTTFLDPIIVVGFTKAFLQYGANPLTTYRRHAGGATDAYPVSEAITKYIALLDHADASGLVNLLEKQIAYFRSRDTCSKKRNRSQSREPRKRQDVRTFW
jgi:hypothetical protein